MALAWYSATRHDECMYTEELSKWLTNHISTSALPWRAGLACVQLHILDAALYRLWYRHAWNLVGCVLHQWESLSLSARQDGMLAGHGWQYVRVKCTVFGNTGSARCTRNAASTISVADVRTSVFAMTFTWLASRTNSLISRVIVGMVHAAHTTYTPI